MNIKGAQAINWRQRIQFYFVEFPVFAIGSVVIIVLALGFLTVAALNAPDGSTTYRSATVSSIAMTYGSHRNLPVLTANAVLDNGTPVYVGVPHEYVITEGDRITIAETTRGWGGKVYSFVSKDGQQDN